MRGYIDNIDFINIECEKYWSFAKSYKGNKQQEIKEMVLSNNYLGTEKKDGMYGRLIKDEDGNCFMISRTESVTGEAINKIDHLPQLKSFLDSLPNGTCLLGEIYFPNNPGSRKVTTVMGCLEDKALARQATGEKLHYYIFDVWADNNSSCLTKTMEEREEILNSYWRAGYSNEYIEYAKYYSGFELEEELARVRQSGGEGIVITKKISYPEPGKRTARKTLKIKTELDSPIDCFLTGRYKPATRKYGGDHEEDWMFWENVKTGEKVNRNCFNEYVSGKTYEPISKAYFYNWASAIELGLVNDKGEEVGVAWISGITDEVKEGIVNNPQKWYHQVVTVNAMQIEQDTHRFRHGRIIEWRNDKPWSDCNISQLWDN